MAHISGFAAAQYREVVAGPDASTAFYVSKEAGAGLKKFGRLSNGDTIMVHAQSLDDPDEWEVSLCTYTSSTQLLARTTVLKSSNSNSAVNFKKTDGSGANVELQGLWGVASTAAAYTITSFSADRTLAATESGAANVAATLATLINDLIDAGIIKGSVS